MSARPLMRKDADDLIMPPDYAAPIILPRGLFLSSIFRSELRSCHANANVPRRCVRDRSQRSFAPAEMVESTTQDLPMDFQVFSARCRFSLQDVWEMSDAIVAATTIQARLSP